MLVNPDFDMCSLPAEMCVYDAASNFFNDNTAKESAGSAPILSEIQADPVKPDHVRICIIGTRRTVQQIKLSQIEEFVNQNGHKY